MHVITDRSTQQFCCGSLLPVFGVRVSVTFQLMRVHIIFNLVWVAEWSFFGKELFTRLTIFSLYILTIRNFSNFPFWFLGLDVGSDCFSFWFLHTFSSPEPKIGELIVYPWSGVRRRRPSVVHNAETSSSQKQFGRSKPNFMWSLLGKRERNFVRGIWVT